MDLSHFFSESSVNNYACNELQLACLVSNNSWNPILHFGF